ncbi:MAG: GIY-YIG nuclease family protein [Methanothrix sp.]|jgi:endonuclease-3|uniref:GIY-YIG nuclease family protein n=2 Tax=Methanothrix sp. TaxID=90426 RepID=UPI0032AFC050|nr:GIY-YIG nuclease family protein [Euryarchaeota archaeon]
MRYGCDEPGIYTIILFLEKGEEIGIGSLGTIDFAPGYYAYTGSARGPGGCKRVDRHVEILEGNRATRRWHIDYLLCKTGLVEVFITRTSRDLECSIAKAVGEHLIPVAGFGCSDCDCVSHLYYGDDLERTREAVSIAHSQAASMALVPSRE